MERIVGGYQPRVVIAALGLLSVAALSLLLTFTSSGEDADTTATSALIGAQATTAGAVSDVPIPILLVDRDGDATFALQGAQATTDVAAAAADTTTSTEATEDTTAPESTPDPESAPEPEADPEPEPEPEPAPEPESAPSLGDIKSKADDKGYDVHGHVEHSVFLLGQQVLIPGQAATGGFIQVSDNQYVAYSPVTAMLPVAIQDNKEVVNKKPNLEGEELYRKLAQEYTGSNDYKNLDEDAQRAINILTCTDWSSVKKSVRENTINHLLHSPISFGTIGSVDDPISTDVTIDLGYTHTRDKNWTEVEYMGNNVFKITVVSNNNNGSHTGHEMGTAFVEMPAGTTLREAQDIGNKMIPSQNKNNKLTIDSAAKALFEALPVGASPLILFEHLTEEEQNAYFQGNGVETVGQPNPDCNPLEGGILDPNAGAAEETPAEEAPAEEAPAEEAPAEEAPAEEAPAEDAPAAEAPAEDAPAAEAPAEEAPAEEAPAEEAPVEGDEAPAEGEAPPADEAPADSTDPPDESTEPEDPSDEST